MAESTAANSHIEFDDPQREYRTIEPWAVGGLALGVLSAPALFGGVLWLLAGVAGVAGVIALRRLRRDPSRGGRSVALVGLALSIIFGVAPAAQILASRVLLSRQARPVADQFLEFLREDSPEKAMMLRFAPDRRRPFDELLWTYYRGDAEARKELEQFVQHPLIRTLLALGSRAEVRLYKTSAVGTDGPRGLVHYWYTVTYPDEDKKKTFFVSLVLERNPTETPGINPWRVAEFHGGGDPRKQLKGK